MTHDLHRRLPAAAALLALAMLALPMLPGAAADPLSFPYTTDFVCHFNTELGSGGALNGASTSVPPYFGTALDDGCPYGESPLYASRTVGFHNNDLSNHIVTVRQASTGGVIYQACLKSDLPSAYDTPTEGTTYVADSTVPHVYAFRIQPGQSYTIEWSLGALSPFVCPASAPTTPPAPGKAIPILAVPNCGPTGGGCLPPQPNCVLDPGGVAFGVNPTVGNLLGRYDQLCVGPHKGCDGVQRNLHDGAGRLVQRQYVDVCTVDGAYVCEGAEWYYYNAGTGGHSIGDHSSSFLPAAWTADQPTDYAGSGWSETCAGVLGTCTGVWYRYGNDYPGGSGKQSYFEWDRETVPHVCV